MSNICFDIYLQREDLRFGIREGVTLDEMASVLSSFFRQEEIWHTMKECWLFNGQSDEFQNLMKEALLGAYDTFCIDDLV